jgi:hypothetical protein
MPRSAHRNIEQVLLHGTTVRRAQTIVNDQRFATQDPLYIVFRSSRDLAEIFACRKAAREHDQPSLLTIVIDEADFQLIRARGDASLIPFDAQDAHYLQSRNQWVISPAGIHLLNQRLISIDSESIPLRS